MKKTLLIVLASIALTACGSPQTKLTDAIENSTGVLPVNEIINSDWKYLRLLPPYSQKTILGEKFSNPADSSCIWVFLGEKDIQQSFEISRELADCVDLPSKAFQPADAIFILDGNKLKVREKFQK